jgi:hypothetical protein
MRASPTLADGIIRESLKKKSRVSKACGRIVAEARKFVLDKEASSFLADLSHAAFDVTIPNEMKIRHLDQARVLSRLPHSKTWIEYDSKEFRRRTLEAYTGMVNSSEGGGLCHQDEVVPRIGWYLEKISDNVFTCLTAVEFEAGVCDMMPYIIAWAVDDSNILESKLRTKGMTLDESREYDSSICTGVQSYRSKSVVIEFDERFVKSKETAFKLASEFTGEIRFIWALLSTINDIPIGRKKIIQDRGFITPAGRYKRFTDYEMISISLPKGRAPQSVARGAVEMSRRRAHHVREHWRRDFRNPLHPLCEHIYETEENGSIHCTLCQGRKILVEENQRGDASLGFVLHDYAVTHDESDQP